MMSRSHRVMMHMLLMGPLVVLLPANDPTSAALSKLRRGGRLALVN